MNGKLFSGGKNFLSVISVPFLLLAAVSMVLLITPMAESAETGNVCVDHYQPGSVCTAQDVRVESFTPHPGTFSGCVNGVGTATFDVKVGAIGSPDRYDIGLFFSQDGSSALTGTSCYHDFLSGPYSSTSRPNIDTDADGFPDSTGTSTNPYWNGDGDVCYDLPTNTNAYRTVTLTFACADLNGDGFIDIPVCSSWSNQAKNDCTGVQDAVPNTKSKCNCAVVPTGLPISVPAISVVKSPANQAVVSGTNATFTIAVTNTGSNAPLSPVTVDDPTCDTLSAPSGPGAPTTLDTGATWTYTCTVNDVTADFTNTVKVTGTSSSGDVTATATANVTVNTPSIQVLKTPSTQTVTSGGTAIFTLTVTNTGAVTLGNITVSDPQCTTLSAPTGPGAPTTLAANSTWTYTCTTTNVTADFINNVTVYGTVPGGPTVSDSASAQVTVTPPSNPVIAVIKTPSNQTVVSGGTATFSLVVTNPGNVPLTNITVTDPDCSTLTGPVGVTTPGTLQTTDTWTYTCTTTNVTADFTNTVMVTGTPPSGPAVSRSATADVTVTAAPLPLIDVLKKPSDQTIVSGGTATFTITVTNPGNVPLTNITVTDPQCTTLTGPVGVTTPGTLQTTDKWTYTCTTTNVTSSFVNTVTVKGTPPEGDDVVDTTLAQVTVLPVVVGPPVQVPTMNEWGMILFMLLAGLAAVYYFRRGRKEG
jgi:hypothetical protein